MRENFLYFLWKHKKFNLFNLRTTNDELLSIKSLGEHNQNSGPDFFNAQLRISDQLWAGNVEMHVKSSDWYLHKHESDFAYDNVILHVVWEHDTEVYRKDNSEIPTLALKDYVSPIVLDNYEKLFSKRLRWINCDNDFHAVDDFVLENWLERLYIERLQDKSSLITELLLALNNDWEAVLFIMLAKSFGLKVNGEPFLGMAKSFDFSILRKVSSNATHIEALLYGQARLLNNETEDSYQLSLEDEYRFLVQKFKLDNSGIPSVQFFRLRPPNFPTIRLSQLASLYHRHQNLFSKIIEAKQKKEFYDIFKVYASSYWETHYNFGKVSKFSKKALTESFIDLILINTVIPIKFAYNRFLGKDSEGEILDLISTISSESNSVLKQFESLRPINASALESQALIQLKTKYCDKHRCLECAVGNSILKA